MDRQADTGLRSQLLCGLVELWTTEGGVYGATIVSDDLVGLLSHSL